MYTAVGELVKFCDSLFAEFSVALALATYHPTQVNLSQTGRYSKAYTPLTFNL